MARQSTPPADPGIDPTPPAPTPVAPPMVSLTVKIHDVSKRQAEMHAIATGQTVSEVIDNLIVILPTYAIQQTS